MSSAERAPVTGDADHNVEHDNGSAGNVGTPTEGRRAELRETYRAQLHASIGGWSGTAIAAVPTVVFVLVNALASLRPAIAAAVGTGLVLAAYRFARKQSMQQAASGLFGVLIAALIAGRTGQARGFFLIGILTSFAYAVPFAISMIMRRPLIGLLWEFLDPSPADPRQAEFAWYRRPVLLRAYQFATFIGTLLFLSRGVVQATLYQANRTGWLAFTRIAMGYPLYIIAVAAGFWIVRRARTRVAAEVAAHLMLTDTLTDSLTDSGESPARTEPGTSRGGATSADDRGADRGLGLG